MVVMLDISDERDLLEKLKGAINEALRNRTLEVLYLHVRGDFT